MANDNFTSFAQAHPTKPAWDAAAPPSSAGPAGCPWRGAPRFSVGISRPAKVEGNKEGGMTVRAPPFKEGTAL